MNEEAGFIAALLAEPDDRTTLLVYADWLDDRADPRAEYLRLLAAERPNQRRLARLRRTLDPIWAYIVTTRIGCGSPVKITEGSFLNSLGEVTAVRQNEAGEIVLTVRVTFWGRPLDVELSPSNVECVAAPSS